MALSDLVQAIADQLRVNLDGVQVEPELVYNPTPPTVDIYPADPFMTQSAYGITNREARFTVRARVSTADQVGGQALLLDMLDPTSPYSIAAALAVDSTFGGTCDDSTIVDDGISGFIVYDTPTGSALSNGVLLGAELRLQVIL